MHKKIISAGEDIKTWEISTQEIKNKIEIFQTADNKTVIKLKYEQETVWLNKEQLVLLFEQDKSIIIRYINNIFKESELEKKEVIAFFAHTTQHGTIKGKMQTKNIEYYNLDVISCIYDSYGFMTHVTTKLI